MKRPSAALLILLAALMVLHWPAFFQGKIYGDEDVLGVFWADKCRLYRLVTGQEQWTFWDPLPFLGMPRLANFQMAWFSPETLVFAILGPYQGWRFFPMLADLGLLLSVYFFLRSQVCSHAAWLGAGFFVLTGDCLKTSQDTGVKFAMACLAIILGCNQRWLMTGRRRFLVILAIVTGWQMNAGAVSQLFFHLLALPFIVSLQALAAPASVRLGRLLLSTTIFVGASLTFCLPWFPLLDWSSHGSREILGKAAFAQAYKASAGEILSLFADELVAFTPVKSLTYCGGYPLLCGFSLAVFLLVIHAWRCKRGRLALILAVFFATQMLGEQSIFVELLHKAIPTTQQIRGPYRFFYPAALLWAYVASLGLDELLKHRAKLAWGLSCWAIGVNLWAMRPAINGAYISAEAMAGIPLPPPGQQRLGVDFSHQPKPPLQWLSYPITQGRACLTLPNVLCEGNYFRGMVYSQYGSNASRVIPRMVYSFSPIPPAYPQHPLLRSWGLRWVLQATPEGFHWKDLGLQPRHWTVIKAMPLADIEAENLWAQQRDWDPLNEAGISGATTELGASPATISISKDEADEQVLQTSGPASLLISADNWDPGWECLIDGKPTPVRRANLTLKACLLPEGQHQVHWRFRPKWIGKALGVSLIGLSLLLLAGLLTSKHKQI